MASYKRSNISATNLSSRQPTLFSAMPGLQRNCKKYSSNDPDQKLYTSIISRMIFNGHLPFSFVENPEFKELLERMHPKYQVRQKQNIGFTFCIQLQLRGYTQ